jgi:hypothetical protein
MLTVSSPGMTASHPTIEPVNGRAGIAFCEAVDGALAFLAGETSLDRGCFADCGASRTGALGPADFAEPSFRRASFG